MNPLPADHGPGQPLALRPTTPRVLVVRAPRLAERLRGLLHERIEVDELPGALSAMAEVATHGAARVVIPAELLHGIEDSAVQTFAELNGVEHLVLVDADEEHAVRLHDHGATCFIESAADDHAWLDTLGDLNGDAETSHERHQTDDRAEPQPFPHEAAPQQPDVSEDESSEPRAAAPSLPVPLVLPWVATAGLDAGALGDADLVDAILDIGAEGGQRAPVLALAMAREQSGLSGLDFAVAQHAHVPADHAAAPVAHRGHHYGQLHAAPPATAEQLAPWAAWLSRWIALDQQARQLRDMAMRDELTGVWNRRYFNRFLNRLLQRAGHDRQPVTLMVFDIDNFKTFNDAHGHAAGDDILRATANLMQSVVRDHDVVARIGGDEFAVIFWDAGSPREAGSTHPDDVLNIAKRFQQAVCELKFPALTRADLGTLTISGGLAGFPWDGRSPDELLHHADMMALESKRKGKNAITFGSGALRCELPEQA